jgi:hypothetical protein
MWAFEYLKKYDSLDVPVVKDDKVTGWKPVKFGKYLLIVGHNPMTWDDNHRNNQAAFDGLLGKLWGYFGRANEKKATFTVHVKGTDGFTYHNDFDTWQELWFHARKAVEGKCSPEEAAITLQLADQFGLTKGDLQAYCDTYLGIDCNGFVGNYLAHGYGSGKPWDADPPGTDYLANKTIDVIVSKLTPATTLTPGVAYVFAMVGAGGKVIPGGGLPAGHIFITDPGLQWESDYVEAGKKAKKVLTMLATESTGGVGLIVAPCQFVDQSDGVFTVKRLSHPGMAPLKFRAYRV